MNISGDYQLKIKISLNESVNDQTTCLAIQGFVWLIPISDRQLFAALIIKISVNRNREKLL